jgi:hypothetical protein
MPVIDVTLDSMAKKKVSSDRHKHPPLYLRLHPAIRAQLEKLTEVNASDLSEEVRIAIRERLKSHGLWPPPSDDSDSSGDGD